MSGEVVSIIKGPVKSCLLSKVENWAASVLCTKLVGHGQDDGASGIQGWFVF